jgi:hypothetical protein
MNVIAERSTPNDLQSHAGSQLHPIKALHRHDGHIKFMVKDSDDPDRMERQFAIRADALDAWFPQFTAALVRDAFFSINGGYTLAYRSSAPCGRPLHDTDSLRFLCACYCDIDYYSRGLTRLQVRTELERMWEGGELPEASMVVDRLLWLLHDAEDSKRAHLGAYTDNRNDHLQLYTRINKALYTRLNHIGADAISDGARCIRVPGSFRNDTEAYVKWRIHGNSDRAISYLLSDLAAHMGVKTARRPPAERAALAATRQPRGRQSKAWRKTNQNRLAALVTIKDQPAGGFNRGCLTVDAARCNPSAISRIDEPEAIPREMSSRSASVSVRSDRRRVVGTTPPRCVNRNRIEPWPLPKARPISCNDSPAFQRRHMSVRCSAESLSRFPCAINTTLRK